ncbi:MAG: hypothetical protein M3Z32_07520 [Acidobacteriota bacterium]|nr:hypothetical protein [Acidobacteriota bacterium]
MLSHLLRQEKPRFRWCLILCLTLALGGAAFGAGTFGKVVSIGGQASDLVLDESRGVLYVANFTANRIEVISLTTNTIQTSMNVAAQPSSMALSPDSRYLVITHFGNFAAPGSPANALTVIDLSTNGKQTFALGNPPLGVAFGVDGRALVVTTTEYLLFDPILGSTQQIDTISGVAAKTLPVPPANFPPQITTASVTATADGLTIFGLGGAAGSFTFRYDVTSRTIRPGGIVTSSGALGPRVASANQDGSLFMAGWVMVDSAGTFVNYFPTHSSQLNIGTTLFDSARGLLYSQIPEKAGEVPVLRISDIDNLNLRERIQLPENLAGKSVLSSDGMTMYGVSDSGVLVLPVGSFVKAPRLAVSQENMVFRGSFCDRRVTSQPLTITDPGGGNTPFSVSTSTPGVTITPSSGVTPATVAVRVDPNAFQNQNGTSSAMLTVQSSKAVNLVPAVRVLINSKQPDQRGTVVNIPGNLVDLLADPIRDRFYVIRQDKNQVLVFDGSNYTQIAALRTGNLPSTMAITFDGRYLLVGNSGAQIVNVFDLETLQATPPIRLPSGHIALSIACSANAILAATQYFDNSHHIVRLDLDSRTGYQPDTLGIFQNKTDANVALVASPNGSSILAVEGDGSVLLYDSVQDTFTVSRKDFNSLSGSYAASIFNQYVAGNNLLNSSLVPVKQLESGTGSSSGFAFVDQLAFRTTVPVAAGATSASSTSSSPVGPSSAPGVIQRLDLSTNDGSISRATRITEAPLLGSTGIDSSPFSRTLAPLYSRNGIVNLTVSGFTILAWDYDASVAPPHIDKVANAADLSPAIAPGGLITLFGQQLSPVNLATKEIPVPTALADSCLTVNGLPMPILFVSPTQINAQLPFESIGNVTIVLRTPGGVSDNYNTVVLPAAPGVFRSGIAGPDSDIPTIVRDRNGELVTASNPVHRGDALVIYLTGLGQTTPAVPTGLPGPSVTLASAVTAPQVSIGGTNLSVTYAGLAPGQVGVYQINAKVPSTAPLGLSVALKITQGSATTSLTVRVVE